MEEELRALEREIRNLTDAVAQGMNSPALRERLLAAERRQGELEGRIAKLKLRGKTTRPDHASGD